MRYLSFDSMKSFFRVFLSIQEKLNIYLKKAFAEATVIEKSNIKTAAYIGPIAHMGLWVVYTYFLETKFENFYFRLFLSILCYLTIFYDKLSEDFRAKYFPYYWHFMIMMALPFQCTFFLFMNDFHPYYLYWEIFCLILTSIYVPHWLIACINFFASFALAKIIYIVWSQNHMLMFPQNFDYYGYFLVLIFSVTSSMLFIYHNRKSWIDKQDRSNKRLNAMAGSIAHELRNPLNAIGLLTENLEDNRQNKEFKYNVRNTLSLASQIIDVTLSEINGKKIEAKDLRELSAINLIKNSLLTYGYRTQREREGVVLILKNPAFEFISSLDENNSNETLNWKINYNELRQLQNFENTGSDPHLNDFSCLDFDFFGSEEICTYILFNLLKNSLYYLNKQENHNMLVEIGIETNVEVRKRELGLMGLYNVIYVRDNGPGIEQSKLKKIFSEFYTDGKSGGTGLGLAFCRRHMQNFGGDIDCESEVGIYTKFNLYFPAENNPKSLDIKNQKNDGQFQGQGEASNKKRILVIDDQKVNLELTKSIIEKNLDLICDIANSGNEAMEIEKSTHNHELIVTDIQMPKISGLITANLIRKINNNIPIIAYSSLEYEDIDSREHANFEFFLRKPVQPHYLLRSIAKLIPYFKDEIIYIDEPALYSEELANKKILIAEDQQINLMMIARMLKKYNIEVDSVENGQELVKMFKDNIIGENSLNKSKYDLILTDINMPVLSGLEAAKLIRQIEKDHKIIHKKNTPIIALSGDGNHEDIKKSFQCGITDYYVKGTDLMLLLKLIIIYLNINKKIHLTTNLEENYAVDQGVVILNLNQLNSFDEIEKSQILKLYIEDSNILLSKIIESQNKDEVQLTIHAFKGITGNIGAQRLYFLLLNIEKDLKNDNLSSDWIEKLRNEYKILSNEIKKYLK